MVRASPDHNITEKTDYHRKDSIHMVRTEGNFDSADRKENKFHIQDIVLGHIIKKLSLDYEWRIRGISSIQEDATLP